MSKLELEWLKWPGAHLREIPKSATPVRYGGKTRFGVLADADAHSVIEPGKNSQLYSAFKVEGLCQNIAAQPTKTMNDAVKFVQNWGFWKGTRTQTVDE